MVLNWIFDSSHQKPEEEQNGHHQDKLLLEEQLEEKHNNPAQDKELFQGKLEEEQNEHDHNKMEKSEELTMNGENFDHKEDKQDHAPHLATLEANYREVSSFSVVDFELNSANWLNNINQQAQQRMLEGLNQIRQSLQADRVLVYAFNGDGSGQVLAESVDTRWSRAGTSFDLDYSLTEANCKPYYPRFRTSISSIKYYKPGVNN